MVLSILLPAIPEDDVLLVCPQQQSSSSTTTSSSSLSFLSNNHNYYYRNSRTATSSTLYPKRIVSPTASLSSSSSSSSCNDHQYPFEYVAILRNDILLLEVGNCHSSITSSFASSSSSSDCESELDQTIHAIVYETKVTTEWSIYTNNKDDESNTGSISSHNNDETINPKWIGLRFHAYDTSSDNINGSSNDDIRTERNKDMTTTTTTTTTTTIWSFCLVYRNDSSIDISIMKQWMIQHLVQYTAIYRYKDMVWKQSMTSLCCQYIFAPLIQQQMTYTSVMLLLQQQQQQSYPTSSSSITTTTTTTEKGDDMTNDAYNNSCCDHDSNNYEDHWIHIADTIIARNRNIVANQQNCTSSNKRDIPVSQMDHTSTLTNNNNNNMSLYVGRFMNNATSNMQHDNHDDEFDNNDDNNIDDDDTDTSNEYEMLSNNDSDEEIEDDDDDNNICDTTPVRTGAIPMNYYYGNNNNPYMLNTNFSKIHHPSSSNNMNNDDNDDDDMAYLNRIAASNSIWNSMTTTTSTVSSSLKSLYDDDDTKTQASFHLNSTKNSIVSNQLYTNDNSRRNSNSSSDTDSTTTDTTTTDHDDTYTSTTGIDGVNENDQHHNHDVVTITTIPFISEIGGNNEHVIKGVIQKQQQSGLVSTKVASISSSVSTSKSCEENNNVKTAPWDIVIHNIGTIFDIVIHFISQHHNHDQQQQHHTQALPSTIQTITEAPSSKADHTIVVTDSDNKINESTLSNNNHKQNDNQPFGCLKSIFPSKPNAIV